MFNFMKKCDSLFISNGIKNTVTIRFRASSSQHTAEIDEIDPIKIKRPKKVETREKFLFKLDGDIEKDHKEKIMTAKQHPGIMSIKSIHPPTQLQEAADKVFEEYLPNDIKVEAKRLWDVLRHREIPIEEDVKEKRRNEIENKLEMKSPIKPLLGLLELQDKNAALTKREKKTDFLLNRNLYNWKPIEYNSYRCIQYLAFRFAPEYAALNRIFHEVKLRIPEFQPRSVFDFGSGIGTVTWAVDNIWPGKCWETTSFDPNNEMNNLNDRLLRGGNSLAKLNKREGATIFKNYMPYSDDVPYDLVVSAYSLFEVGTLDSRGKMLDILWRKVAPGGLLVIVEQGSNAGYEMVIQARQYLLHLIQQEIDQGDEGSHIFAPCQHDKFCPRYFASKTPCSFQVKYHELRIGESNENTGKENMCYVVFQRGEKNASNTKCKWPRVVANIYSKSKCIEIRTCNSEGNLELYTCTKRRHGSACYQICKQTSKGDLLPIEIIESTNDEEI